MTDPTPGALPPLLPLLGRRRVFVSLNPRLADSPLRRSLHDNSTHRASAATSPTRKAPTS